MYTGGTIGMAPADRDAPDSALVPQHLDRLRSWLPPTIEELGIDWTIAGLTDDVRSDVAALDSSDVGAANWGYMATAIERAYDDYDGFVLLHGTDTMSFTVSALSFMLSNLGKPVVVTGALLPPSIRELMASRISSIRC